MNKEELKELLGKLKRCKSDFIGNYNYKKDCLEWEKKHGKNLILSKVELPKWMTKPNN